MSFFSKIFNGNKSALTVHDYGTDGYTTYKWTIGKDVSEADAKEFTEDGCLYVFHAYINGAKTSYFIKTKSHWLKMKSQLDSA